MSVKIQARMGFMRRVLVVWGFINLLLAVLTFRIYSQASADIFKFGNAELFSKLGAALFLLFLLLLVIYPFSHKLTHHESSQLIET